MLFCAVGLCCWARGLEIRDRALCHSVLWVHVTGLEGWK